MKKILIALASLSVVACSNDCVCDVQVDGIPAEVELSAPDMESCDDVSYGDLDLSNTPQWDTINGQNWDDSFVLVCEEE